MAKTIWTWKHFVNGVEIGEIRRLPDEDGGKLDLPFYVKKGNHWTAGAPEAPRPLFGIDSVKNVNLPVIVCEGQKVCTAFHGLGFQAVSLVGGAYAYDYTDWKSLRDCKHIWFAPDNDLPGEHCMQAAWNHMKSFESEKKVIRLPGLKNKDDLCDWLKRQPELEEWNELDPLATHPAKTALKARLDETLNKSLRQIEWTPWDEWKPPIPVDTRLRPVRRIVEAMIPLPIRPWLLDLQKRMGCPLEYLAVPAVAAGGAALGAAVTVRPKKKAPWAVVPNNFGGIVGPPSTMKTACIDAALGPLEMIDTERFKTYNQLKEEHDKQKFVYDQELNALKERGRDAAKSPQRRKNIYKEETIEDVADQLKAPPKPPTLERLIVKDSTKEAITKILANNAKGVLITLDELVQLIASWDKEGRQGERQLFLTGWNGNQPYTVDRASFGEEGQRIPRLCISIIGGMQPDTLKSYLVDNSEASNDGMIQRFQLLCYLDNEDDLSDEDMDEYEDEGAKYNYNLVFRNMATWDWTEHGATAVEDGLPYFRFSDEPELDENGEDPDSAQSLWTQWRAIQKEKVRREDNAMIQQHLSKYPSLMPSLALIFHCMEIALGKQPGPIDRANTQMAIDWCEFLEEHARRIYAMSKPADLVVATNLASKIQTGKLGARFTIRDVQRNCWQQLKKSSDIMSACRQLSDLNWLRQIHTKSQKGGPPKVEFLVNPEVIDDQTV